MKTIEVRLHIQANYNINNTNGWDVSYIIPNKDLEVVIDTDDLLEDEDIKGCESHFRKDKNVLYMSTFFDFETNVSDEDYRDIKDGKFVQVDFCKDLINRIEISLDYVDPDEFNYPIEMLTNLIGRPTFVYMVMQ